MNTILMYHYIDEPPSADRSHRGLYVPRAEFRSQLKEMKNLSLTAVDPDQYDMHLKNGHKKERTVWITFDDGKRDNYTNAFPALKEAGMIATFFVTVDPCLQEKKGYICRSELKEMLDEGMSIGSHTLSHPRLARIEASQLRAELFDSKKKLEDFLGVEVPSFCYPYGNFNDKVVELVKEAGYKLALSTIRDNRNHEADRWRLKRAMVQPGRVGSRFRYTFSPLYHILHSWKNRKRWKKRRASAIK